MEYNKCLVELDEVLNYLSEEDLSKIPEDIRNAIKEQKDKEYIWEYDESKRLDEQKLDRKTIAILSYLNMEYLLNEKQKEFMINLHKKNEIKQALTKGEKYNPDNLFKNNNNQSTQKEENSLIEYKPQGIFVKIINIIKGWFRRKE